MSQLYLLRHGQTEFNLNHLVQGRCDAPLTELGIAQAHAAARWLIEQHVRFDRLCTSPLGRAKATLGLVRADLSSAGVTDLPEIKPVDGLMERSRRWKNGVYGLTVLAVGLYAAFYPVLIGLMVPTWYTSDLLKWLPSWPF